MDLEELKNYLRIRGLKVNERKHELVARVFVASENGVKPIKTPVGVEDDLKTDDVVNIDILRTDDRNSPPPFKILHGWMNEDECKKFWPILLYPAIFNYLMFFLSQLGSKDLNDYKSSKANSSYK